MDFLLVLLAAAAYRIPRGGPGEDVWRKWIGAAARFRPPGAVTWATILGLSAWAWGMPPLAAAVIAGLMWIGEKPGYSQWWRGESVGDILRMSLRGVLLLNPIFGVIYALAFRLRNKLPRYGDVFDGWTSWAELASGFVTASAIYTLTKVLF